MEDSNHLKRLKGHYPNNKLCLFYYCSGGISISKIHSSYKIQKHILGSPPINRKMVELLFLLLKHNMPIINYGDLIYFNNSIRFFPHYLCFLFKNKYACAHFWRIMIWLCITTTWQCSLSNSKCQVPCKRPSPDLSLRVQNTVPPLRFCPVLISSF